MKSKFKNVITGIIFAVGILISTAAVKADIQYVDLKTDDIYQSGTISQEGEMDFYRVTIPSAGWLSVNYQGFDVEDSYVQVQNYDQSYTYWKYELYTTSNIAPKTTSKTMALEAGTYIIKVYGYGNHTGKYRLKASFEAANNNEKEDNNTFVNAMALGNGNLVTGFLSIDDTVDFYKFTLNERKTVIFYYTATIEDSYFQLWNKDFVSVKEQNIYGASETTPKTYTYEETLEPRVYYIKIRPCGSYTGKYTLKYEYKNVVSSIGISGNQVVAAGKTLVLTANVLPADATDKSVEWTSGDTSIATVDEKTGVVTTLRAGKVKITASALDGSNVSKTVTVIVKPKKMAKPSAYINYGRNIRISWNSADGASGYQIQYGLKKSASKAKYLKARRNAYYKYLTLRRKTYYIRVRAYYKTGKKVYYGNWSSYRKIRVK